MIKVPAGKVVRQIGTYRYENTEQMIKTIPIVDFSTSKNKGFLAIT